MLDLHIDVLHESTPKIRHLPREKARTLYLSSEKKKKKRVKRELR